MSIQFGEGTGTLAKGLYDILSASIPAEKALYVLSVSAKAARAGLTDTGVAADAITTILNAYGLSAEKAGDVSDWLFSVVKKGKLTFAELAPSIGMVATTASSAGVDLNELGAALGVSGAMNAALGLRFGFDAVVFAIFLTPFMLMTTIIS
jgi:TP901 family phage tail tape measure protein